MSADLIEIGNRVIAERKEREAFTSEQRDLLKRSLVRKGERPASCIFVDSPELRKVFGVVLKEE